MATLKECKDIHQNEIFTKILRECEVLRGKDGKDINKNAILLWGIVLCSGDSGLKTSTFYDILQETGMDRITARDKDFPGNFNIMIDLSTKVINEYEALHTGKEPERSEEFMKKLDSLRETLAEDQFIDVVFDHNSNMTRKEWEDQVNTKVQWIYESDNLRRHIYAIVEKL